MAPENDLPDATDIAETPARRTRAPRRATKKASAPAVDAAAHEALGTPVAAEPGDAQAVADVVDELEADAPPARKRAPRTTAAKAAKGAKKAAKKAAKAVEGAVDGATDPGAPADEAPAKKAARKSTRTATKKAAKATAPVDALVEDAAAAAAGADEAMPLVDAIELATADDGETPLAVTVVSVDEVLEALPAAGAEHDGGEDDEEGEEDDEVRLTVPSFGLLFQAPDPTRARRSRRASAPATEPTPAAERDDAPADDVVDDDNDDNVVDDDLDGGAEQDDSRRGRGRRGRASRTDRSGRRRAAEQDDRDEQDDATDDVEDAEDADGTDDAAVGDTPRRRRSRGGRGRKRSAEQSADDRADDGDAASEGADDSDRSESSDSDDDQGEGTSRRRRRRRRAGSGGDVEDMPGVVTKVREPRRSSEATGIKGSTRLEAKKQRRREGREAGRRRTIITEAEFLARREAVARSMVVRVKDGRTQIAVLEDGVLVEHYVSQETSQVSTSMAGNIYLGRVQNVLPSMEAAFVDIGKGRNAVLYAGEVNWDAAGLENGQARRIENAHKTGDTVLVQATKDPIGHKGARLTSQISLPGRYLVFVPNGSMTGISRKLPDTERSRLKKILREVMPENAGVIVRTAAEGASEAELRADVARLTQLWEDIQKKASARSTHAPALLHGEPDLTVRVIRDVFNEDFTSLVVSGDDAWGSIKPYIDSVAPDLADRVTRWTDEDEDVFASHRIDEQLAKAMDRKVYLPSGGSLVIDRTEAMTVVDVNTGKFTGAGGNLEETVTKNNLEAAEEVVRQLRLRDIGGIIVVDFIDMVLESNRDLVLRRLVECLGRDRTRHQVAEVTSLGLVQMTRKRVGTGLVEAFSEVCTCCNGRGLIIHDAPVGTGHIEEAPDKPRRSRRGRSGGSQAPAAEAPTAAPEERPQSGPTPAQIAAAAHAAAQAAATRTESAPQEAPASDAEVAAAIEVAVTAALGEAVAPAAERAPEPVEEPTPQPRRGRRSRRAVSAPAQAPAPRSSEPVVAPPAAVEQQQAVETEPQTEPQTDDEAPAPRRPRRSRRAVSAPAGPPKVAEAAPEPADGSVVPQVGDPVVSTGEQPADEAVTADVEVSTVDPAEAEATGIVQSLVPDEAVDGLGEGQAEDVQADVHEHILAEDPGTQEAGSADAETGPDTPLAEG